MHTVLSSADCDGRTMISPSLVCCKDICHGNEPGDIEADDIVAEVKVVTQPNPEVIPANSEVESELSIKACEMEVEEVELRSESADNCTDSLPTCSKVQSESDCKHLISQKKSSSELNLQEKDSSLPSEAMISITSQDIDSFKHLQTSPPRVHYSNIQTKNRPGLKRRSSCHVMSSRKVKLSPGQIKRVMTASFTVTTPSPGNKPSLRRRTSVSGTVRQSSLFQVGSPHQEVLEDEDSPEESAKSGVKRWDSLRKSIKTSSEKLVEMARVKRSNTIGAGPRGAWRSRRKSVATTTPRLYNTTANMPDCEF